MTGFIHYLENNCHYNPNPFLITTRDEDLSKDSGLRDLKEAESTRLSPRRDTHLEKNYNLDHIAAPFEKYEAPEVIQTTKPASNLGNNELKHLILTEYKKHGELFLRQHAKLSEITSYSARNVKKRDVFDRLTDHRFFTGIHRERFDEHGRGRGLAGRENLYLFDGSTESYSRVHEVYSSVLPKPERARARSTPVRKFGLQVAAPKIMWLYRNGDKHHDGVPFYLRPFIRSMETLHVEIGKELTLIAGPVRRLYDQNLRRVTHIDQIVDGAKYLCTSGEPPAPADKLDKFLSEWVIQKMF